SSRNCARRNGYGTPPPICAMRQRSRNRSQLWCRSRSPTRNPGNLRLSLGISLVWAIFPDLKDVNRFRRLLSQGSEEGSLTSQGRVAKTPPLIEKISCLALI